MFGEMDVWKDGCLKRWLFGKLAGWKVGWVETWLGGKLAGWKVGCLVESFEFNEIIQEFIDQLSIDYRIWVPNARGARASSERLGRGDGL